MLHKCCTKGVDVILLQFVSLSSVGRLEERTAENVNRAIDLRHPLSPLETRVNIPILPSNSHLSYVLNV
jgi:hypothetical protein